MAKYEYLAIKKPDELKGVYHGDQNIKKVFKKIQGVKGVSSRTFAKGQESEALKWAGVKGLADVPQVALTKIKEAKKEAKKETKKISDIEYVIEKYKKDGDVTANIHLISGKKIIIQIRDIYYIDNRYSRLYSEHDSNSNSKFYSQRRNSETYRYEYYYNKELFEREKGDIRVFKATDITYLETGMLLKGYDVEDIRLTGDGSPAHEYRNLFIKFDAIETIKPTGFWTHLGTKITDEDIIKDCEKLFKS